MITTNCYRRCKTTRDLVDFCSGYYPNIAKWVRMERSRGVSADAIKDTLRAIKSDIIEKHEATDLPQGWILAELAGH